MESLVVIGNGVAGLTAAESARAAGFEGQLTIVGDEAHPPYSRPALSKAALLDDDPAHLRLPESTHGATELLGVRAVALDVAACTVSLSDGRHIPFDGLVIATGARPRRLLPPDSPAATHELVLRNLDDMALLRSRLAGRPSIVVVGGGPLGMEAASGAVAAGCKVTLVSQGQPLRRHLGPYLADMVGDVATDKGLLVDETGCAAVSHDGSKVSVETGGGTRVDADCLITAVGDLPNLEWLEGTGLVSGGVLLVDSRGRVMQDGHPRSDIVAAGDVATFPTRSGARRVPLWTSAIDQAKVAGATLALGEDAPQLDFSPYFWTDQFGLNIRASGHLPPDGDPEVLQGDPAARSVLLGWTAPDGRKTAVAVNFRIPIPRLRKLAS